MALIIHDVDVEATADSGAFQDGTLRFNCHISDALGDRLTLVMLDSHQPEFLAAMAFAVSKGFVKLGE